MLSDQEIHEVLATRTPAVSGELIYRFEARLQELNPVGILPEGLRFANPFEGTVTEGPLSGARVWGIDEFLLRPDGIGVIDAPEVLSLDGLHVTGQVRGYALPPAGLAMPALDALLEPGFEWPDVPFAIRGSVMLRTANPDLDHLNRAVGIVRGAVRMDTGELIIEARAV